MNPMTNMKNVLKLSEGDLKNDSKTSWHDMYKDSAWIFVGGLPYDLTEGDVICVFSQYGEIVNINLVRDKASGKSRGFCFICYEDQRSTILAVDNLNGIKILNRTIRVDHVAEYKVPKENDKADEITKKLQMEGCAPKPQIPPEQIKKEIIKPIESWDGEVKLPPRLPIGRIKTNSEIKQEKDSFDYKNIKKEKTEIKKIKKEKKLKKKRRHSSSSSRSSTNGSGKSSEKSNHLKNSYRLDKNKYYKKRRKSKDRSRNKSKNEFEYHQKRGRSKESNRCKSRSKEKFLRNSRSRSQERFEHRNRSRDKFIKNKSRSRSKERTKIRNRSSDKLRRNRSRSRSKSRNRCRKRSKERY